MNRSVVSELKRDCLPRLCLDTLSSEHIVFSKMLCRARNQHRRDKSFQLMSGVSRQVKKYLLFNLFAKVKTIINKLYSVRASVRNIPPEVEKAVDEMYLQLLEAATFCAELVSFTEDTWREVNLRLVKGLFIPFNTVMLASLSRIWFCIRFHLVGIAETYAVLKSTAPQTKPPVVHVVSHLKLCHRAYLNTPALQHLQPTASDPSASNIRHTGVGVLDTGVAVELTEEKLRARMRDCGLPLHQPPSLVPPATPPLPSESETSISESRSSVHHNVTDSQDRNRKRLKRSRREKACKPPAQTTDMSQTPPSHPDESQPREESGDCSSLMRETKKKGRKQKKFRCRAEMRCRQRTTLPVGGSFRQYIARQSGRQRMIIGSKIWAKKKKNKQRQLVAVEDTKATASLSLISPYSYRGVAPLTSTTSESQGDIHQMQTLFQYQMDGVTVGDETATDDGSDDIDLIFSGLQ